MLTATYSLLGLAAFVLAALVCFSKGRPSLAMEMRIPAPAWSRETKWPEIKTLWLKWQIQCQEIVSRRQQTLLWWGRTFAFCAAICVVGILLRARLDQQMSTSRIWSWLRPFADLLALWI
jgi:hypothetical protein